jgi:MoaA/NifB/PqqE/SkfB family radical SAM enzyme
MEIPKTICMLPWISIETSPIGSARPCCLAIEEITDEFGHKYDLNKTDLQTIYNSVYMQKLRQQFRNGVKPKTCSRCWDEEAAGRTSKRINSRIRLKELYTQVDWANDSPDQLWFLDLKLGNICNLKCRICGSWSSSKWAAEELDYMPKGSDKKQHIAYQWLKQGSWPRNPETNFWANLKQLLPNVKYIEFTGGEPWLIEEHFDLLKYAVENGYSKNIDIHYNTNATQLPGEFDAEIWREFGRVDIAFSIDNVGARFEYERYGAKWDLANEIIDYVHYSQASMPNITTQLCFTINVQNVYYLDELLAWADTKPFGSVYFNMMHSPDHMSIQQMTAAAQELVLNKLKTAFWKSSKYQREIDNVIKFIQQGAGSDGREFLEKMQRTDEYRKQDFQDTHPEIAQAMGYTK